MEQKQITVEQDDYNGKIRTIASKMAVNKYNYFQGKGINLDEEISGNLDLVKNKISQIYKTIEEKIPGLDLPRDLNDKIAEYLLMNLKPDTVEINQVDNNGELSERIFKREVLGNKDQEEIDAHISKKSFNSDYSYSESDRMENQDEKQENLSEKYHGLDGDLFREIPIDDDIIEQYKDIGNVTAVFEDTDGGKIVFLDPNNEKYKIPEDEADEVEEEIFLKQRETEKNDENAKYGIDIDVKQCITNYKKNLHGLGIDGKLRAMYRNLVTSGAIEVVSNDSQYNEYRRESLYALLDSVKKENAVENSYDEDSYTLITKLGIFSRLMNDPIMQIDGEYQKELHDRLRNTDPELYSLLERDPKILEKIQTRGNTKYLMNAIIEIFGTSDSKSRGDFFQMAEEVSRTVDDKEIEEEVTDGFENYENDYKNFLIEKRNQEKRYRIKCALEAKMNNPIDMEQIPMSIRINMRKSTIEKLIKKAGVGTAINSFFTLKRINGDRGQTLEAVNELLNFDEIGNEGNYVSQITDKDIQIMRDQLNVLLENQNEKIAPYICVLGDIIAKASEREKAKIISADNLKTEEIVSKFGDGTDILKMRERKEGRIKSATFTLKSNDRPTNDDDAR